jgi:hypothetical protein
MRGAGGPPRVHRVVHQPCRVMPRGVTQIPTLPFNARAYARTSTHLAGLNVGAPLDLSLKAASKRGADDVRVLFGAHCPGSCSRKLQRLAPPHPPPPTPTHPTTATITRWRSSFPVPQAHQHTYAKTHAPATRTGPKAKTLRSAPASHKPPTILGARWAEWQVVSKYPPPSPHAGCTHRGGGNSAPPAVLMQKGGISCRIFVAGVRQVMCRPRSLFRKLGWLPPCRVERQRVLHGTGCVCMVCDFFHPSVGGVEQHIWSLSQCLLRLGWRVIVVTHAYGDCRGVRHMAGGLKVYYTPMTPFTQKVALPTYTALLPIFRDIVLRERVLIVHGHQVRCAGVRRAAPPLLWTLAVSFQHAASACCWRVLLRRRPPPWPTNAYCRHAPWASR